MLKTSWEKMLRARKGTDWCSASAPIAAEVPMIAGKTTKLIQTDHSVILGMSVFHLGDQLAPTRFIWSPKIKRTP